MTAEEPTMEKPRQRARIASICENDFFLSASSPHAQVTGAMPPPAPRRITTKDIARTLGLDASTVGRALRDHPEIAEETKRRVRAAVRKLGYREDPALKSLVAYRWAPRTRTSLVPLGLLLDPEAGRDAHPGEREALALGRKRANEMGYRLDVFSLCGRNTAGSIGKTLYHRGVTGLIIGRTARAYESGAFDLDWNRFAAVAVDAGKTAFPCHNVLANHFKAMLRLWRSLRAAGFRRVGGVLQNDLTWRVHPQEIGAFAYAQLDLPADERIPLCFASPDTDRETISAWVRQHRPEVVIGRDETILEALRSTGLRVPHDVAFAALERASDTAGVAGFGYATSSYAEAVIQLDALLRLNRLGLPEERHVVLIDPPWHPGTTLPGIVELAL